MSRRDGAIVAWYEVPGLLPPPNQPSRRVRCDWRRCAHRFDDLESRWYLAVSANGPLHRAADRNRRTQTLQEEYLAFLKNTAPIATEISLELLRPIRPYPTGRFVRGAPFPGTSCQATIGCPYGTQDEEQKSPKPPYLRAIQPRVSSLGNIQERRFALKGREVR